MANLSLWFTLSCLLNSINIFVIRNTLNQTRQSTKIPIQLIQSRLMILLMSKLIFELFVEYICVMPCFKTLITTYGNILKNRNPCECETLICYTCSARILLSYCTLNLQFLLYLLDWSFFFINYFLIFMSLKKETKTKKIRRYWLIIL